MRGLVFFLREVLVTRLNHIEREPVNRSPIVFVNV